MGHIFDIYEFNKLKNNLMNFTVFSLLSLETIKDKFHNYKHISLGELLSVELIKFEKEQRNLMIAPELEKILTRTDSNKIIITDADILFNPEYRLDVVKSFIQLSRNRNLIVQWPGEYDDGNLIYSKPEYNDYKKYAIKDYDVICLK